MILKQALRTGAIGFICLVCAWTVVNAQDLDQLKNVVPPSPNASSLGKYADWPVSLYTGVPEISIPLYQVRGRSISVPISLNYHASGIKVSEVASWAGLGFSLDAGGVITRSVRGLPDDDGGFLSLREDRINRNDLTSSTIQNPILQDSLFVLRVAKGELDSEPDYFMFSAMGRSYKMFFYGDSIVTQPKSNLKFRYVFSNVSGGYTNQPGGPIAYWQVWLEDGTLLHFGTPETTLNARHGSADINPTTPTTGWYLDEVISTSGEHIILNYNLETTTQGMNFSQSQNKDLQFLGYSEIKDSYSRPQITVPILTNIISDQDSVTFSTIDREDFSDGNALSEITVYSRQDRTCIRRFKFDFIYFGSTTSSKYWDEPGDEKRLMLSKVTEGSADYSEKKEWTFAYNPARLPSRNSYAQDHFGFFNGATGNSTLLPRDLRFPASVPYANRECSADAMAQILTKITYPTGGSSEFNFEQNSHQVYGGHYKDETIYTAAVEDEHHFILNEKMFVRIGLAGAVKAYADVTNAIVWINVERDDNGPMNDAAGISIKKSDIPGVSDQQIRDGAFGNFSKVADFELDSGHYHVTIHTLDTAYVVGVNGSFNYQKYVVENYTKNDGGIRVSSVFDYDNVSGDSIKRYFKYEKPFVIHNPASLDYQAVTKTRTYNCTIGGEGNIPIHDNYYQTRYSNNVGAIGTISGGSVGWGKVTIFYGSPEGANGKSTSWFSNVNDYGDGQNFPYPPITDQSWRRGQLLEKRDYRQDGKILQRQVTSYDFDNPLLVKAKKISFTYTPVGGCIIFTNPYELVTQVPYDIVTEQVKQIKMTTTQYSYGANGAVDSLIVERNSYYDSPYNMQATRVETLESDSTFVRTKTYTALEKASITGYSSWASTIDSLAARNMISQPLQVETYKNNNLVQRITSYYKKWTPSKEYLQDSVKVKNGSGVDEVRVQILSYDASGNLIEQRKASDLTHAYIYDYKNSLPIAEVVNASAANIAFTSFESDGKGNWSFTSSARVSDAFTGTKGYSLSNGAISKSGLTTTVSYKVSLWAKMGATITINSATVLPSDSRRGWSLYSTTVSSVSSVSISGTGTIDDIKLYPKVATMSTYTHGPHGVSSVTNTNETNMFYEYDGLGRLSLIRDHQWNILKKYEYNYQKR